MLAHPFCEVDQGQEQRGGVGVQRVLDHKLGWHPVQAYTGGTWGIQTSSRAYDDVLWVHRSSLLLSNDTLCALCILARILTHTSTTNLQRHVTAIATRHCNHHSHQNDLTSKAAPCFCLWSQNLLPRDPTLSSHRIQPMSNHIPANHGAPRVADEQVKALVP